METATDGPLPIGLALAKLTIPPPPSRSEQYEAQERNRQNEARDRRRASVWQALVAERGARYAKATLANYVASTEKQQAAKGAVQSYIDGIAENLTAGRNVLFIGPPGTGKDHLMFSMARPAIAQYKTLLWVNGTTLWLKLRESFDKHGSDYAIRGLFSYDEFDATLPGTEGGIVEKLSTVDVLAISDPVPPAAPLTDYQAGILFTIIDRRYSHLRPTWLTINCANRKEAESRIGASTVDRLAHDALVVLCDWPSHRQAKQ